MGLGSLRTPGTGVWGEYAYFWYSVREVQLLGNFSFWLSALKHGKQYAEVPMGRKIGK